MVSTLSITKRFKENQVFKCFSGLFVKAVSTLNRTNEGLMGGPTDDAAHDAFAGVAGDEGVGCGASAEVVAVGVDDESSADDAKGSGEAEVWVDDIDGRGAVLVCADISQVAEVAVGGSEATVCAPGGVEVSAHGLAPVAEIPEFVDMESVEAGRETRDRSGYAEAVRALIDENGCVGDAVAP